jgi:hypothetical protein
LQLTDHLVCLFDLRYNVRLSASLFFLYSLKFVLGFVAGQVEPDDFIISMSQLLLKLGAIAPGFMAGFLHLSDLLSQLSICDLKFMVCLL